MEVLYLLITCSAVVALFFLGGFIWSVKNEQYDDTYGPPVRMLFEDDIVENNSEEANEPVQQNGDRKI